MERAPGSNNAMHSTTPGGFVEAQMGQTGAAKSSPTINWRHTPPLTPARFSICCDGEEYFYGFD
jgi:hypothetical protein